VRRRSSFDFVSPKERWEAELFFLDLIGHLPRGRSTPTFESAAEDAAEDRARADIRDKVADLGHASPRASFLSGADLAAAMGSGASADVTSALDAAVAAAAPARRQADAAPVGQQGQLLAIYWTLVNNGAARVAAEIERDGFRCTSGGTTSRVVDLAVVDGMRATWTRSGETLTPGALCRGAPTRCPSPHANLHSPLGSTASMAAHFTDLAQDTIRTAEIAGLWGLDLRGVAHARRPAVAVKPLPTAAPLQALSFVGIRRGEHREIHVARESQRRVEAWVDGDPWLSFPSIPGMAPGTGYRLWKRRYWEASLHRQWGTLFTVWWLVGLANFYRDRTGTMLGVGDISHVVGEVMTDHGSHRVGKDLDCYVLDAPPAGSAFPVAYWCSGRRDALELRELEAPSAAAAQPEYGVPSGGAAIADPRRAALLDRYATILAYCIATQDGVNAAVWHGAPSLAARALAIAQQAWDDTLAAHAGTTERAGWRATWGFGPRQRADIVAARAGLLIGEGSGSYGAGRGWPPHQDHIHVRLR